MCATEWPCGRILCPACGEESVDKLAIYTADQFRHVRVEACDTCGCYIKTVDLTKNGRAVPIVDELASIPLNLWPGTSLRESAIKYTRHLKRIRSRLFELPLQHQIDVREAEGTSRVARSTGGVARAYTPPN